MLSEHTNGPTHSSDPFTIRPLGSGHRGARPPRRSPGPLCFALGFLEVGFAGLPLLRMAASLTDGMTWACGRVPPLGTIPARIREKNHEGKHIRFPQKCKASGGKRGTSGRRVESSRGALCCRRARAGKKWSQRFAGNSNQAGSQSGASPSCCLSPSGPLHHVFLCRVDSLR